MGRRRRDPYTGDLLAWAAARDTRDTSWTSPTFTLLDATKVEVRPYSDAAFQAWERSERFGIVANTASGKTYLAYMLADRILAAGKRVIMSAPTATLCAQHTALARDVFRVEPEAIACVTGAKAPGRRAQLWPACRLAITTPQTLANDLASETLTLDGVGLIVIDECHAAAKRHATIAIAAAARAAGVRLVALTASPGGTAARIERTRQNLHLIEWVRIDEHATSAFRPPVQSRTVRVPLDEPMVAIVDGLENVLERVTRILSERGLLDESSRIPSLARLNEAMDRAAARKDRHALPYASAAFHLATICASIVSDDYDVARARLEHATTKRWKGKDGKPGGLTTTAKRLRMTPEVARAREALDCAVSEATVHPKQIATMTIVRDAMEHGAVRGLIYNRYADGVKRLHALLAEEYGDRIGMVLGIKYMRPDDAMAQLQALARGERSWIIATDAIREGIHIPAVDILVLYSPPRNAIETIQLSGRVGRTMPGNIVQVLAEHPIDERFAITATAAAKRMRTLLSPQGGVPPCATPVLRDGQSPIAPHDGTRVRRSYFSGTPEKPKHTLVTALDAGFVFERFRVERGQVVARTRVRPYATFRLSDRTGWISLFHWCPDGLTQAEALVRLFTPGAIVIVAGLLDRNGHEPRITVNPRDGQHMTTCPEGDYDPKDYVSALPF